MVFLRDVPTEDATPPRWAEVVEIVEELPLTFGDCELCGATIGEGVPMICDECISNGMEA